MSAVLATLARLSETAWDDYLYHATDTEFNPKEIRAGSHLGSLHAAMARGVKHRDEDTRLIHAYKYKPSGKSCEVEDDCFNEPDSDSEKIAGQLKRGERALSAAVPRRDHPRRG
jgi:hypothetical protein